MTILFLFQMIVFQRPSLFELISSSMASEVGNSISMVPEIVDVTKLRDPFRRPDISEENVIKTTLEKMPIGNFKLVGVMTGPDRLRAMLMGPDGRSYFVAEKTRIGINGGVVKKITPDKIVVREKITNILGSKENVDVEIRFSQKNQENPAQM